MIFLFPGKKYLVAMGALIALVGGCPIGPDKEQVYCPEERVTVSRAVY